MLDARRSNSRSPSHDLLRRSGRCSSKLGHQVVCRTPTKADVDVASQLQEQIDVWFALFEAIRQCLQLCFGWCRRREIAKAIFWTHHQTKNKENGIALLANAQAFVSASCSCGRQRDMGNAADLLNAGSVATSLLYGREPIPPLSCRIRVWREPWQQFLPQHVQIADQQVASLHVWAGITPTMPSRTELIFFERNVNAERYGALLHDHLMLFNGPEHCLLPDVNATPHRAALVKQMKRQIGLRSLRWSSRSPDMNPIKHVWSLMKRKIHQHTILSLLIDIS